MIGLGAVLRSEFTKLFTSRTAVLTAAIIIGTYGLLLIAPATLFAEAVAAMAPDGTIEIFVGERTDARSALTEQLLASTVQAAMFVPIVGAVLGGLEFRQGQSGTALVAVPARGRLFASKVIVGTVFLTVVAVVTAILTSGMMLLVVWPVDPAIVLAPEALIGQGRFVLFTVLYSLTAFAASFAFRRTFVAIVGLALLTALTLSQVLTAVSPVLDAIVPLSAGRNFLLDPATTSLTASPDAGLVVITAWALSGLGGAYLVFAIRDAKR